MEAWLTELEIEISNCYPQNYHSSDELMNASFNEQLSFTLGEDFPYPVCSDENIQHKTTFSQCGFDYDIIDQLNVPSLEKNQNQVNDNKDSYYVVQEMNEQCQNNKEDAKKEAESGGIKRKRQPSQVQDHVIAERKRRELLGQLFISLSVLVPGLKKTDKTSVLGEAIKYMKQLKEKVKVLEEVANKRSIVVVKKSPLSVDNESGDDNDSSCTMDCNCRQPNNNGGNDNNDNEKGYRRNNYLIPEIEVKISGKTLLLRVYCENGKGVIAKLFALVDKHDMSISSCNVIPFESLALDITIVAVMETGFNSNVKDFVKSLRSSFPSANSHRCCTSS